jgi:hypothetical protein
MGFSFAVEKTAFFTNSKMVWFTEIVSFFGFRISKIL